MMRIFTARIPDMPGKRRRNFPAFKPFVVGRALVVRHVRRNDENELLYDDKICIVTADGNVVCAVTVRHYRRKAGLKEGGRQQR